MSPKS